jgi:hypothetical protein
MSLLLMGAGWLVFVLSCFAFMAWENSNDEIV